MIRFEEIQKNKEINAYIEQGDVVMRALGFTEHSFAHATKVAKTASGLLKQLGFDDETCNLAAIAGYMHDIGNTANRNDHAQTGAIMAFSILRTLGMDPKHTACIVSAIGNHDESSCFPPDAVGAALVLADKSDIRRSRVRNRNKTNFDIHDRVNYAATQSELQLNDREKTITLQIQIDTETASTIEYFEIFLQRMLLCQKAADKLGLKFRLQINGHSMI